ncbi:MAG: hypothetical protein D4S01_09535 [Dehalococcoidia bacterium]|nr:MAG: hypothetical protein D4S01_09535 [Dehalococcoidia bacterium]
MLTKEQVRERLQDHDDFVTEGDVTIVMMGSVNHQFISFVVLVKDEPILFMLDEDTAIDAYMVAR